MPDITVFSHGDRWSVAERDAEPLKEFSSPQTAEMAARVMAGDGSVEILEDDPTGLDGATAGEPATTDHPETPQPADVPESPRMMQLGL
jgi:hypothetical protein